MRKYDKFKENQKNDSTPIKENVLQSGSKDQEGCIMTVNISLMDIISPIDKDQEGIYYGPASTGGQVILKQWKRDKEKISPNVVVIGERGFGKCITFKNITHEEGEDKHLNNPNQSLSPETPMHQEIDDASCRKAEIKRKEKINNA